MRIYDFIDEIHLLHPAKIDIESGETDGLRGGIKTLNPWRPFVTVECGAQGYSLYGYTKRTLFDFRSLDRLYRWRPVRCDLPGPRNVGGQSLIWSTGTGCSFHRSG